MKRNLILGLTAAGTLCITLAGHAGGHDGAGRPFASLSGFEGQEEMLGAAVADAIREVSAEPTADHDFTGREKTLGHAVATAIRTMNVREPYQHEMNDALVKMTLTHIQFAKDNGLLDEMIAEEIRIQRPMLERVGKMIEQPGRQELAIIAMTDRTACFYQLVEEADREPGKITYRSPFGNVLAVTRKLGQHDLTEQEIHEIWTVPRIKGQAAVMGVDVEVSEWREDGVITISLPEDVRAAMANAGT
jgi:hypothetical protein